MYTIHIRARSLKLYWGYCWRNGQQNRAAYYAFKALKYGYLSDCVRSNWRLEKYELFCKNLPMCYPLTLNWVKIWCPCSSGTLGSSSRHNLPSKLILNCSKNNIFTKLSIFNHARTCKENPIHFSIKAHIEALNGINDI